MDDFMMEELMRQSKTARPCILCGKQTHSRGIYMPTDPRTIGAQEGQPGVIIYPFCEDHEFNEQNARIAEEKALAEFTLCRVPIIDAENQ